MHIHTARLHLRLWQRTEGEAFHTIFGDPKVIWWGPAETLQQSVEIVGSVIDRCQALPAAYGWYAVMNQDKEIIGNVLLQHPRSMPDETEIGWQFRRVAQGQGFATEAAKGLLAVGFETLDVARIIALITPTNHPSQRVAQRLGMKITEQIEHAGKPHDVWTITRAEFEVLEASSTD